MIFKTSISKVRLGFFRGFGAVVHWCNRTARTFAHNPPDPPMARVACEHAAVHPTRTTSREPHRILRSRGPRSN